jgi:hypothetical protein
MITPIPNLSAYSGGGVTMRRMLLNYGRISKAKEQVIVMRFPVVEVPESPELKGEFGPWELVTKPLCRPYYLATLHIATLSGDDYNVNFILDPDDSTPDHVLQERVDARVHEIIAQVEGATG